jgi:hypothetical protein
MGGLIVQDEDNAVIRVVARVRAVWTPGHGEQHDKCRCHVRASLAKLMKHRRNHGTPKAAIRHLVMLQIQ